MYNFFIVVSFGSGNNLGEFFKVIGGGNGSYC